jgi:hypothetical protein
MSDAAAIAVDTLAVTTWFLHTLQRVDTLAGRVPAYYRTLALDRKTLGAPHPLAQKRGGCARLAFLALGLVFGPGVASEEALFWRDSSGNISWILRPTRLAQETCHPAKMRTPAPM